MSLDKFDKKVSQSDIGANNPVLARQMAEHSPAGVNELREWGFFESPLYQFSFSILNAEMKLRASLMRKESRCSPAGKSPPVFLGNYNGVR